MNKPKPEISFADRDAYTIPEFCVSNGISRGSYYNMPPGDRPVEMAIGGCKRISREARFDWRRRLEARAAARDDVEASVAARAHERDDIDADGNDAEGEDDDGDDADAEAA